MKRSQFQRAWRAKTDAIHAFPYLATDGHPHALQHSFGVIPRRPWFINAGGTFTTQPCQKQARFYLRAGHRQNKVLRLQFAASRSARQPQRRATFKAGADRNAHLLQGVHDPSHGAALEAGGAFQNGWQSCSGKDTRQQPQGGGRITTIDGEAGRVQAAQAPAGHAQGIPVQSPGHFEGSQRL
ncbi:hypothetical protein SDC9_120937 [bioreactor metagenome]|uniref:Uncharacterized protein n=1 Tax=bioreactor metagenome TaxID=1076179 RepID=A0A645CAM4_9ZZZZ